MNTYNNSEKNIQCVGLIGAKSFGLYGGYETFIDKLTEYHKDCKDIKYYVAVKANGQGAGTPDGAIRKKDGYIYHNANCFEIKIPEWLGAAQAIYYDCAAMAKFIRIIKEEKISHPIVYIMTCRFGPLFNHYARQIRRLGGRIYLNPDGHEWMRAKWSASVKKYWKYSEKTMVCGADLVICDSKNIEKYVRDTYKIRNTTYIAYGAETGKSECPEEKFEAWLKEKEIKQGEYYLTVGRFAPENNYETLVREFMKSNTQKDLVIITNNTSAYFSKLEKKLHFSTDPRIKFVGTVYDKELLKKIREEAYANFHGHEVGGTNPSLLEALSSTKLNLLLDIKFNREVAEDAALYWNKEDGNLSKLINKYDNVDREEYGRRAKERIKTAYSWKYISDRYAEIWNS